MKKAYLFLFLVINLRALQVPGLSGSRSASQAQNILRGHYLSLTKQLNENQTPEKDLSYEEIRQSALAGLDADIANLEQKIDSLGDTPVHREASALVPLLSQLVEHWRKKDIDNIQAYKIIQDYITKMNSFQGKIDLPIYKYMQRLGDKIIEQYHLISEKIAALPLPNQGAWKEVYDLIQNICNANNMPIPKIYYGNGETIGQPQIFRSRTSIYGRPIIFIPEQYIKSSQIEELKGVVVHELGHLYYGDTDIKRRDFHESVRSSGKLGDDFWQKQNYQKEYAADIFAAFYGFGEQVAEGLIKSHYYEMLNEHFRKLLEKKAPSQEIGSEKKKELASHPTSASRFKNMLESLETTPGFINVPHMELSTQPSEYAHQITIDTSPYHKYIEPEAFKKMAGPVWTQRPYVGPKKIDISATPVFKRTDPLKQAAEKSNYTFRAGLQNVAAKASAILKRVPK